MPTDPVEIANRFAYHPPSTEDVAENHEYIRSLCWNLANSLNNVCPESRELSLALTKVEEAMFWANAAVARNQ